MWNQEEWIRKAEELKPELKNERVYPVSFSRNEKLNSGDSIVIDFGNHFVGHFSFHCKSSGSHQDAPLFVKIKFCESAKELDEDSSTYKGWVSRSWIQEEWLHVDVLPSLVSLPRRYAFRYVKIDILDVSPKYSVIIDEAYADCTTSADDTVVTEFKGNDIEEKIDRVAVRTLRNCMQDLFEDGPKRDRRLWIGDLRLQALANSVTFKDYSLVKRCLYLFAGCCDESGRIPACIFTEPGISGDNTFMFDYSLFFISVLYDYARMSGDIETAKDLLPVAVRQWQLAKEAFGPDDVIEDSDRMGWCFIDWNLELNKQAGAQFIYIYTLKDLLMLMKLAGETDTDLLQADIQKKSEAAVKYFFDPDRKLFVSGKEKQVSFATESWAVLSGVLSKDESRELMLRLERYKDALRMVTPYMNHVYVEALIKAGLRDEAYKHMIYYWGGMIDDGADTFYELFNPENPDESPYGSTIVNSYCHAWSCTPTYFMRKLNLVEKKKHPEAFIFDLDGVIVFTDRFHFKAWKKIADRLGVFFDENVNNRLRGVSRMDSLEIILEKYTGEELSAKDKEAIAGEKNEIYREYLKEMTPEDVSSEVRETLTELKRRGYKIAIGSSSKNAKFILDKVGIADMFDAVSDGTNIEKSKPDPEVFVKAAEFLDINPEQCVVVEDAYSGIDAAKAAGMYAVGIGEAEGCDKKDAGIDRFSGLLLLNLITEEAYE